MDKFRVVLFTGNYNHIRDGVSLTLNRLVKFLESNGVELLVFGPSIRNPALEHNGRLVEIPSISMPGRPEYRISIGLPARERDELEKFDPDIVHIATPDILGYKALKWAKNRNKKIVSSYHTHFPSYLKYYKLQFLELPGWVYMRWFYSHCLQIYVPTSSMIETLKAHGVEGEMKVWARGVDNELFSPSKRDMEWRRNLGFKNDDVVVTFVSRIVWEKNLRTYAEAVQAAAERNPKVRPLVVGDGPVLPELKSLLPEAVFTGYLTGEALAKAYASSDIFLFPSDTETFGNVTLEAMTCGLPCVVADAVGSKSLVDHNANGYLIPVSETKRFTEAVSKLAEDKDLRTQMSRISLLKSKQYTWDQINNNLLSYYRMIL